MDNAVAAACVLKYVIMVFWGARSLCPLTQRHNGKRAQDVHKERELRSLSLSTAYSVRRRVNPTLRQVQVL